MQSRSRPLLLLFLSTSTFFAIGCQLIAGLGDLHLVASDAGIAGAGGMGTGGGGIVASSSSSGSAGAGGAGGGETTNVVWSKRFGDLAPQYVTDVAVDNNGNIFVVGTFQGSIDFGSGAALTASNDYDGFIAKLDPDGAEIWSRAFGSTGPDRIESVALTDAGDPIVVGSYSATFSFGGTNWTNGGALDAFVFKLASTDGGLAWGKRFGGAQDQRCASVTVIPASQDVICWGDFAGTIDFGGGTMVASAGVEDVILVRYSSAGAFQSATRWGDGQSQRARSTIATGSSNLFVGALFDGVINWAGSNVASSGSGDVFIGKFLPDASQSWSMRMGDSKTQRINAVRDVPGGGIVAVGAFEGAGQFGNKALVSEGAYDAFVARIDSNGNALWVRTLGDDNPMTSVDDQEAMDAVATEDGSIFITGHAAGTVDFGSSAPSGPGDSDFFLTYMGPDGQTVWNLRAGSASPQFGRALALSGSMHLVVAGDFRATLDLGNGPLDSAGSNDIFVAKLNR